MVFLIVSKEPLSKLTPELKLTFVSLILSVAFIKLSSSKPNFAFIEFGISLSFATDSCIAFCDSVVSMPIFVSISY